MKKQEIKILKPYANELSDIVHTVEAYNVDIETIRKIVRLAAIMDTEKYPGYTYKHLKNHYKEIHDYIEVEGY